MTIWRVAVPLLALSIVIVTDLTSHRIPDLVTLPAAVYALISSLFGGYAAFKSAVLGAAIAGGAILLLAIVSRGGIGGGDLKLMIFLGAAVGWEWALSVFLLSQFVGLAVIGLVLAAGRKFSNNKLPIGAIIAALAAVVVATNF